MPRRDEAPRADKASRARRSRPETAPASKRPPERPSGHGRKLTRTPTSTRPHEPASPSTRPRVGTRARESHRAPEPAPAAERPRSRRATRAPERTQTLLAKQRAFEVLSRMRRDGESFRDACHKAGTTPRTVQRHAASALRKGKGGRYEAKPSDRLARTVQFLTPKGPEAVTVRSSRMASRIAEHAAAVSHYLRTGDASRLRAFRGAFVRVGKERRLFLTDLSAIEQLASAGEFTYEDLYATTS